MNGWTLTDLHALPESYYRSLVALVLEDLDRAARETD